MVPSEYRVLKAAQSMHSTYLIPSAEIRLVLSVLSNKKDFTVLYTWHFAGFDYEIGVK